jgi:hypothetical protein
MSNNRFDYLIPAIKLMRKGESHVDSFRKISKDFGVTYQTVSAQCTRHLGIPTNVFVDLVKNHKITEFLIKQFPNEQAFIIEKLS